MTFVGRPYRGQHPLLNLYPIAILTDETREGGPHGRSIVGEIAQRLHAKFDA